MISKLVPVIMGVLICYYYFNISLPHPLVHDSDQE